MSNPTTIAEFLVGSMTMVVYALFPVLLFLIMKIIRDTKFNLRDLLFLGLLGFFVFNVHAAFWYIIIIIPVLLIAIFFRQTNLKKILRLFIPIIIGITILLPNIIGYTGIYSATNSHRILFNSYASYTYGDATLSNLLRLAGNKGSAQSEEFLDYNSLSYLTIIGVIFSIIAFIPLITIRKQQLRKIIILLVFSTVFSFLLASGMILTIKNYPYIVDLHPILSSLRNPVKLMYPLSFSICFLFALGIESIIKKIIMIGQKNVLLKKSIVGVLLVGLILVYNYPALDGTMGLAKTRDNNYSVDNKYFDLISKFEAIDSDYKDYRVLFLPWELSTSLMATSINPNYFGFPAGTSVSSDIAWLKNVYEYTTSKNITDRNLLLSLFSVKYVVVE